MSVYCGAEKMTYIPKFVSFFSAVLSVSGDYYCIMIRSKLRQIDCASDLK